MAEQQNNFLYNFYNDLTEALKSIGVKMFLGRRPKTSKEELNAFLVIKLNTRMHNIIAGGIDRMPHCYGTIHVFYKAKDDGTLNVQGHTELVDKVIKCFPIAGKHLAGTRPEILMDGEDGYGYQVTIISFSIRGK